MNYKRKAWRACRAPVLLGSMLVLVACGNLTTTPLNLTTTMPGTEMQGLPFTLNRIAFIVVRTPGAASHPDTYVLTPVYEADPNRRFQLQLDPASPFATVDWTVSYDGNGSLTSTNAKITDQTVQVITSLGKLAAAVVPLGAAAGSSYNAKLTSAHSKEKHDPCTDLTETDGKIVAEATVDKDPLDDISTGLSLASPDDLSIWNQLKQRLKDKNTPFFYRSRKEQDVLNEVLRVASGAFPLTACYVAAYAAQHPPASGDAAAAIANEIDSAVKAGDVKKLLKTLSDAKAGADADAAKLTQKFNAEVNLDYQIDPDTKIPTDLETAFAQIDLENKFIAEASGYKLVYDGTGSNTTNDGMHPALKILADAVQMDKATVEARQLAALDKCIADLREQERLKILGLDEPSAGVTPPPADDDPAGLCQTANGSEVLMVKKAQLLQLASLFRARTALEASLDRMQGKEMKAATDEIAAIDAQIAAAQAALTTAAVSKVDDPVQARVIVYQPAEGPPPPEDPATAIMKDATIRKTHPQYVIVLQPPYPPKTK